jgi:hypothetical protein
MATSQKKTPEPSKDNLNQLLIPNDANKTEKRLFAEAGLSATVLNSATAKNFTKCLMGESDLTETINAMKEKVSKVNAGDLTELEATLTAQSVSLDAVFNELARRAIGSDTMSKLEIYMRLSLKAQSQCARTIEVLAAMKNPPIVYAKQANIAHGNQQVNNGSNQTSTHAPAHTGKIINQPNGLLEAHHGSKKMDTRATQTTIHQDQAMAALET